MHYSDRNAKSPYYCVLKERIYSFLLSISDNYIGSMIQSVLRKDDLDMMRAKNIPDSVNNKQVVKGNNKIISYDHFAQLDLL